MMSLEDLMDLIATDTAESPLPSSPSLPVKKSEFSKLIDQWSELPCNDAFDAAAYFLGGISFCMQCDERLSKKEITRILKDAIESRKS